MKSMKSLNVKQLDEIWKKIETVLMHSFDFTDEEILDEIVLIKNRLGLTGIIDRPDSYLTMNRDGAIKEFDHTEKKEIVESIKVVIFHCLKQKEPEEKDENKDNLFK
jgi:hypothetical protein